ncbi:MAG: Asp23/Gls24 family envelope stress response protein [Clostridiales bacterium]|nr:Asp23/Gls24 family envelope stress response protein [Clostridiales bacterium]
MAEIENKRDIGQIQISDEVIAAIGGTAALEIEGVAGMAGNFTGDIAEKLGRKNMSKGVRVEVNDSVISLDIHIIVKFGCIIQDVAATVQKRVKTAVETMTGLSAPEINVFVSNVTFDKGTTKE